MPFQDHEEPIGRGQRPSAVETVGLDVCRRDAQQARHLAWVRGHDDRPPLRGCEAASVAREGVEGVGVQHERRTRAVDEAAEEGPYTVTGAEARPGGDHGRRERQDRLQRVGRQGA